MVDERTALTDLQSFETDGSARTEYLEYSARVALQTILEEADLSHLTFIQAQALVDLALQIRGALIDLRSGA